MALQINKLPIIQTGTFERTVIHPKPGWPDNMKTRTGRGAKPGDIARVWRYLRFVKCDMQHLYLVLVKSSGRLPKSR